MNYCQRCGADIRATNGHGCGSGGTASLISPVKPESLSFEELGRLYNSQPEELSEDVCPSCGRGICVGCPFKDSWEEEFDEKANTVTQHGGFALVFSQSLDPVSVKEYIRTERQKEYERGRKEGYQDGTVDQMNTSKFIQKGIRTNTLNEIQKIVEGMKEHTPEEITYKDGITGYHFSLNTILHRLQDLRS